MRKHSPNLISGSDGPSPRNRKACRGRRCLQAFLKEPNSDFGGGVPLFQQTPLGGGVSRLNFEALWEEVHRFDETDHTWTSAVRQRLCCTAMHQPQQSLGHTLRWSRSSRSSSVWRLDYDVVDIANPTSLPGRFQCPLRIKLTNRGKIESALFFNGGNCRLDPAFAHLIDGVGL